MRWACIIEYDGTNFHGWQMQPGQRTVQGVLELALAELLNVETRITAAGRTDAGVHARGQVIHFDVSATGIPPEKLTQALNQKLPDDVALRWSGQVADSFHARYDANRRVYRYRLAKGPAILDRHQVWDVVYALQPEWLQACADRIRGRHDFSSFCQAQTETENHICTIMQAKWELGHDLKSHTFHIEGDRFLHHMVRMLVGTMVEVARGKWSMEQFEDLMTKPNLQAATVTAPALGLVLEAVGYPAGSGLPGGFP